MKAPFIYIGGKSRIAPLVWQLLGDVDTYLEPFAGSAAVLLARPQDHIGKTETINDADGLIVNVWRSLAWSPKEIAAHADWPATESDLHARHSWLVGQRDSLTAKLEGDPGYHDPKIAGGWLWGAALWIGSGWCAGVGPWHSVDGEFVKLTNDGQGVTRQLIHLSSDGQGVKRRSLDAESDGVGAIPWGDGAHLLKWFSAIAKRLEHVNICAGSWDRICGPAQRRTIGNRICGVFLDPPYAASERSADLYAVDSGTVAADVREWCAENAAENVRIVLCGVDEEHDELLADGWSKQHWSGTGGYGRASKPDGVLARRHLEAIWISPHCLGEANKQGELL